MNHFSKLVFPFKNYIKKTWEIIKDSIGKGKRNNQNFPQKVIVDNIAITDETQILISFFKEIGQKLAKELETSTIKLGESLFKIQGTLLGVAANKYLLKGNKRNT